MDEKTIREVFEAEHRHLDVSMHKDSWGRPEYVHSHVEATWRGFLACYQHLAPMVEDAERYRYLQGSVCATRVAPARCEFFLQLPLPVKDPMRGSVAQHFDEAIDAAREQEKKTC
ncbi:hypothetical protein [Ralstonia sp. Ralssp135]|uniref:hypothetical protein n=1 Tax=Ralstonia sp. Ralssp135 TaxID=3243016 RepID=UPI0039B066B0